jgi:hypothetical protein
MEQARDALIDEAMERAADEPMEAAATLFTAGYSILAAAIGMGPAHALMPGIVAHLTKDSSH